MGDKNRSILEIASRPGNDVCADCRQADVQYASFNLGVFLCTTCVSVHRQMGTHISRTKHLKHDRWSDETTIAFMAEAGNAAVNAVYEKHVPDCYQRPNESSAPVLLEQFIRAKYERQEFMHPERQRAYTDTAKSGHLFKRYRDISKFEIRNFVLSEAQNTLAYYVNPRKTPKLVMHLNSVNVTMVPEKINHPNGMQITYVNKGNIRHLYVYHNDGQIMVDWYMAIRNAKLNNLLVAFPGSSVAELTPSLSRDFALEGWLYKSGPRAGDQYRRRWFTLDGRKLMYHDGPLDPVPKGVIPIGEKPDFSVVEGVPPGALDQGFSFTLRTPQRTYLLSAQSDRERARWLKTLADLLEQPLTPQDRALACSLQRKPVSGRLGLSRSFSDNLHKAHQQLPEGQPAGGSLRAQRSPQMLSGSDFNLFRL